MSRQPPVATVKLNQNMARLAVLSHIHESFLNNASDNVASLRPERRHIGLADKLGVNARLALKSFNEFREVSPQILVRDLGNNAAHQLVAMTRNDSRAALVVMEDLLNFLYDLDYRASQIKNASKNVSSDPPSRDL
jgi:hypothetical protein